MARYFLMTLPISAGKPQLPAVLETAITNGTVEATREGTSFRLKQVPPDGTTGRPEMKSLVGRYLGTAQGKAVVICTGSKSALQWLRGRVVDPDNGDYQFKSLAQAWQIEAVRDWLKPRINWIPGEFGPVPGSTYGRPLLPVVYCGQNHDPYAPSEDI